jgi:hypothetical protein
MLSISLLFDFISSLPISLFLEIILASSAIKKRAALFSIEYFLGFFVTGLIFKILEEVISSGEMSERSIVLRVFNEDSAEIGNICRKLVTSLEVTQTRVTFLDAVSIEVLAQQVSEMENKYSATMLQLEGKLPVGSKALTPTPTDANLLQANQ